MKKKILIIAFVILSVFVLSGCKKDTKNVVGKENVLENVKMTIKEGTLTSKGAVVVINDAVKDEDHTYTTFFRIDKKDDGKWLKVDTKINDYNFEDINYHVNDDNVLELEVNWEELYGSLAKGNYRLVIKREVLVVLICYMLNLP